MYRIFVIEDDDKLRALISDVLQRYKYEVFEVQDFANVEAEFDRINPHLTLLDINLPYFDGFYLCRALRKKSRAAIVIISARSGEMDQVLGIELGADDYIVKPFRIELLLAKIKAVLRRGYGRYTLSDGTQVKVKNLVLDNDSFRLIYRGKALELSKNEYRLIRKLMENNGKVVRREELLEELWDDGEFVEDNTLNVNVSRIKNKLKSLGIYNAIKTKRGVGYILDSEVL